MLLALASALLCCGGTPGPAALTFSVTVPADTPAASTVWLTGNQPELGSWNGHVVALAPGADGKYVAKVVLAAGTALEFKFLLDDRWEVAAGGLDIVNRTYTVAQSAQLDLTVARWAAPGGCTPTTTGTIRRHAQVSPGAIPVKARDLIVYLPPGYDLNTSVRYPVLYMHDGQNLMDACTSFAASEWHADETAEQLIGQGKVAPLIIVGVYNTSDRIPDYTPVPDPRYGGGNADAYGRFLVEVVKPLIDSTYRTRPEAQYTGVAGSSLGGLVSMYFALTRYDTFTRFGVVSPSVWWAGRDIVARVNALASKPAVKIWEDIGTSEGDADALPDARTLRDSLLAKGWAQGTDFSYLEAAGAGHNEAAWSARFGQVLEFLYPP